jgi:predicted nucleic acid-binding protein
VKVATVGHATADFYAEIRLELKSQGTPIPSNDTWIAAMTRQHQLPLLSQDHHFDQVKDIHRILF